MSAQISLFILIIFCYFSFIALGKDDYYTSINESGGTSEDRDDNRPFLEKKNELYSKLKQLNPTNGKRTRSIRITVNRERIFKDSFDALKEFVIGPSFKLGIKFQGERFAYFEGLTLEWFSLLTEDMFNPRHKLFKYCTPENYGIEIDPLSDGNNLDVLRQFEFIGKITAWAIHKRHAINVAFSAPFLKSILDKNINLGDVKCVDPQCYKSLLYVKHDPSTSHLYFIDEQKDSDGKIKTIKLKPDGDNTPVNKENVDEYISLLIEWKYKQRVQKQISAFLRGFETLVPLELIKPFKANELELLLCGTTVIDINDWRENTRYGTGTLLTYKEYAKNNPLYRIIEWFWEVAKSFTNEERIKLLHFITGSSRIPINGFKELLNSGTPLILTVDTYLKTNSFPKAHTCFRRLDLPIYDSPKILKTKLVIAMNESEGFW